MSGNRRWSDAEDSLIRAHYLRGGIDACLDHLEGRSAHSVYVRARRLGLVGANVRIQAIDDCIAVAREIDREDDNNYGAAASGAAARVVEELERLKRIAAR